jgi:hypothetical protein
LFNCARCHEQCRACTPCDGGNRFCPECRPVARRESVREYGRAYARSAKGRANSQRRQKSYRVRKARTAAERTTVTHHRSANAVSGRQGLASSAATVATPTLVASSTIPAVERVIVATGAKETSRDPKTSSGAIAVAIASRPLYLCTFCGRALPELARLGPLRRRRASHRRRARPRVYRC